MERNIGDDINSMYNKVIISGYKLPPGVYPSVDGLISILEQLRQVADERKFEQTASVMCALESVTLKCLQNGYKEALYCGNHLLARQCQIQMMDLKSRRKNDEIVDNRTLLSQTSAASKRFAYAESLINAECSMSVNNNFVFKDRRDVGKDDTVTHWPFASRIINESVQSQFTSGTSKAMTHPLESGEVKTMNERNPPVLAGNSKDHYKITSDTTLHMLRPYPINTNSVDIGNNFKTFSSSRTLPPRHDFSLDAIRPTQDTVIGNNLRGVNMNRIIPQRHDVPVLPIGISKPVINFHQLGVSRSRGNHANQALSNEKPSGSYQEKIKNNRRTPNKKEGIILPAKKSSERLSKLKTNRDIQSEDSKEKSKNSKVAFIKENKSNNSISKLRKSFDQFETSKCKNEIIEKKGKSNNLSKVQLSPKPRRSRGTPGILKQNDSNISRKQRPKLDKSSTPVRRYSKLNKIVDSVKVNRNKRKHYSDYLCDVNSTLRPRAKRFRSVASTPLECNKSASKNVSKSRQCKRSMDSKVSCANSMDCSAVTTDVSSAYNETPKSTMSNRRGNVRILYKRNLFSTPRDRSRRKWLK